MSESADEGVVDISSTLKPPDHDIFLASLVSLANTLGVEQGITLAVGGALISGQLIGGRQYFEELAAVVTSGATTGDQEVRSGIADSFRAWTAIYDKPDPLPDDYIAPVPGYIHLRDARWIYPGGTVIPTNRGVLWRGKISAIDGFCLGQTGPARG
jgi:hypothetical protein